MMNAEGRNEERQPRPILERTKQFALRIVRLYVALPKSTEAQVIGKQVLRSGTSVAHIVAKGIAGDPEWNSSAN